MSFNQTQESSSSDNSHISSIHALYFKLKVFPQPSQYTVLAAFYLTSNTRPDCNIISLGTGTKCLPECRLPSQGEAIHDSHAEILARRGAIRWLLEEILRERDQGSQWIECHEYMYRFREGIELNMYISTVPCGDASTRFLAAFQDLEMAFLKDSTVVTHSEGTAARGRDNYHLFNVLRTKPGRADSPPTLSLSCSDKIASWSWLGIQGAFGAKFFDRGIYIRKIIIGEVFSSKDKALIELVSADCERALGGRLEGGLPSDKGPYFLHKPAIWFTPIAFMHSRFVVGLGTTSTSSNESLCWYADSLPPSPQSPARALSPPSSSKSLSEKIETLPHSNAFCTQSSPSHIGTAQVIINGYKRGVSPKHRQKLKDDKFLPQVSKLSMFRLYARICREVYETKIPSSFTYYNVKNGIHNSSQQEQGRYSRYMNSAYLEAKTCLKGRSGPFSAWWDQDVVPTTAVKSDEGLSGRRNETHKRAGPESSKDEADVQTTQLEIRQRRGYGHWERFNIYGELIK
ncbi:hypothetical protein DFH05DRAFT_1553497 [Lentinula detonsa]|uniref:A to I editase domain-containing protein n=1 Tax=Lentinula detonsa TaxID=2804962 RepID=A0A9W8PAI7_9AGAR|nr:hypothetical protein DFH05DRAFT_1553497 [Lentinula detonsa]